MNYFYNIIFEVGEEYSMDVYKVKKTLVEGVWEMGKLESDNNWHTRGIGDPRIKQLLQFLGAKVFREHSMTRRPKNRSEFKMIGSGHLWHQDGCKDSFYRKGQIIIMTSCDSPNLGTRFRDSNKILNGKSWVIYLVNGSVWHRAPHTLVPRHLTRFYIKPIGGV